MSKNLDLLSVSDCDSAVSGGQLVRKLHDGGGLYLWVHADGRKFWRFRYWLVGKEKSLSLGSYPATSIDDARASRDTIREQLNSGQDPSELRKAARRDAKSAQLSSQFRLALSDDGALTLETPSRVVHLTRPQTDVLKAFFVGC